MIQTMAAKKVSGKRLTVVQHSVSLWRLRFDPGNSLCPGGCGSQRVSLRRRDPYDCADDPAKRTRVAGGLYRFAELSVGIVIALRFAILWPEGEDPHAGSAVFTK